MSRIPRVALLSLALLIGASGCDDAGDLAPRTGATDSRPPAPPSPARDGDAATERQTVQSFEPAFSFKPRPGAPLQARFESPRLVLLSAGGADQIVFARPEQVYLYAGGRPSLGPAPDDLAEWIEANPHLRVKKRAPVTVGGMEGRSIDVAVTSTVDYSGCPISCVPLLQLRETDIPVFLAREQRARFVILAAGAEEMLIAVTSSPRDFESFMRSAAKVLRSVRF